MDKETMKQYAFYIVRWQLSSPVMLGVFWIVDIFGPMDYLIKIVVSNFVGALIFFWVDKRLFK